MRLARAVIDERPTELVSDGDGWVRLSALVDLPGGPGAIVAALRRRDEITHRLQGYTGPRLPEDQTLLPPVVEPGKIVAVGLNYVDHAAEVEIEVPAAPLTFAKHPTSIAGPYDEIPWRPDLTVQLDYEVELAVVIGQPIKDATAETARAAIGAFAVANDVSARDVQFSDVQWSRGKGFDGYCPIGPWLTPHDDVDDLDLTLRSLVNGEVRQQARTEDMIFGLTRLLIHISAGTTLLPGDVVLTGTPQGVAMGLPSKPWLRPGDVVRCEISGLGALENRVASTA